MNRTPSLISRFFWSRWTFYVSVAVVGLLMIAMAAIVLAFLCISALAAFQWVIRGPYPVDWTGVIAISCILSITGFIAFCCHRVDKERENPYR